MRTATTQPSDRAERDRTGFSEALARILDGLDVAAPKMSNFQPTLLISKESTPAPNK